VLLLTGQNVESKKITDLGYKFKFPTLQLAVEDILSRPLLKHHVPVNPNYAHLDESAIPRYPPVVDHAHH